jgi:DNA-binding NarL/FixJ family response regulator
VSVEGTVIRVFLLDDHEVVRRGVRELLDAEDDITVVGEAGSAEEALGRIPPTRPHVALLDVRLPDGNGVEVCREIRSRHPEVACIMLTSFSDDDALMQAVVAGASGYLLKQIRGVDIVDAVRRVARGEFLLDPSLTERLRAKFRNASEEDHRLARLTSQERRILVLIADGLTNRQIGAEMHLAEKTVKNYVSNLLAKLGMERRTQAAVFAARLDSPGDRKDDRGAIPGSLT